MIINISSRLIRKFVRQKILKPIVVSDKNITNCSCLQTKTFSNYSRKVEKFNTNWHWEVNLSSRFNSNISTDLKPELLTRNQFEALCTETLDSLCDYFEELTESSDLKGCDVTYSDGVLTVNLGPKNGTYVINRQSPNLQIWLSSPTSGPKRYDYSLKEKCWIYRHDNRTLHELLQEEIPNILKMETDFCSCSLGKREKL